MLQTEQEFVASPEMRKFFERLLNVKQDLKIHSQKTRDAVLYEIYKQLDDIIKEANS